VRVRIDPAACDGFGYCAEIVPEIISLDEWGFPIVKEGEILESLLPVARRAVAFCPRRALTLGDSSTVQAGSNGKPQTWLALRRVTFADDVRKQSS
jgi:ferredoxin